MALPKKPKKEAKTASITVRFVPSVADHLRILATEHGLSQGDVMSHLIENEFKKWAKSKDK